MAKRHRHGTGPAPKKAPPKPRAYHPVPEVTASPDRFDEAIHAFERRSPMVREEWDKLKEDERERAFTVSAVADADLVTDVFNAIDRALRDGTDFEEFKARVADDLTDAWGGEDSPRLANIFRTNVMGAYNAGREAVFTAPAVKEARPYSRFDAIDDDRTCPDCEALNGTILPVDDPYWDGNSPPLHFQDRCVKTGVSQADADDAGGVDDTPEEDHADDGFGARPSLSAADWEPDFSRYPEPIRQALQVKLDR